METISSMNTTASEIVAAAGGHRVFLYPGSEERQNRDSYGPTETKTFETLEAAVAFTQAHLEATNDAFTAYLRPDVTTVTLEQYLDAVNLNGRWLQTKPEIMAKGNWIGILMPAQDWREIDVNTAKDLEDYLEACHQRELEKSRYDYSDLDIPEDEPEVFTIGETHEDGLEPGHHGHCMHRLDPETCTHGCFHEANRA